MNRLASILLLLIASTSASAGWVLNNDASRVNFVTTKANVAAEVHTFKQLEGRVDDDGNATVSIDLNSVDTSIEILGDDTYSFPDPYTAPELADQNARCSVDHASANRGDFAAKINAIAVFDAGAIAFRNKLYDRFTFAVT